MKLAASLIFLLLGAAGANAAPTVLYQTGWEAAPAYPAWGLGAVYPQNDWAAFNTVDGHAVVANGSQGAISTPYGTRFHKFTASSSTAESFDRLAWPDITAAFNGRPVGANIIKASVDMYIPSTQSADESWYGMAAFHGTALPWGVFVNPSARAVLTVADETIPTFQEAAFALDTWFNLTATVNYASGQISIAIDGVNMPALAATSTNTMGGGLTDVDLFNSNGIVPPTTRIAYSDNYLVTAEAGALVRPSLTITPGPPVPDGDPRLWHLSWSAVYSDWILESTQNLHPNGNLTVWTNVSVTPNISGDVASVDLLEAPPRTFYRLRQP